VYPALLTRKPSAPGTYASASRTLKKRRFFTAKTLTGQTANRQSPMNKGNIPRPPLAARETAIKSDKN
jgi:hypothetical protein